MANLKNTNINDNLQLPQGTTAQRPASPQEGQIRYNTDLETAEFYNGANWRPLSDTHPEATGGTVVDTDIGGVPYRIHYFTETGTDTLTVTNPGEVDYLIVAGGGSGGSRHAGGGGAGGLLTGTTTLTPQTYNILVGAGGVSSFNYGTTNNIPGGDGGNSSAFELTAIGGGGGGQSGGFGRPGGSGGGGGENNSEPGGAGTPGQGFAGGDGNPVSSWGGAGGGGGAGGPGQRGQLRANPAGGNGGPGILSNISGNNIFYAGGGGGSTYGYNTSTSPTVKNHGVGGVGGGGRAGTTNGGGGANNTGGGGGGGSSNGDATGRGGYGGSGIVIVRYRRNNLTTTSPDRTLTTTQPLRINEPGRHFYNITASRTGVDYYILTTPFDLDTRKLISNLNPVGTLSGITRSDNMAISNDGTQLYICATNDILNYKLSVPFDVSSAQLDFRLENFHSANEPTCFVFADNGRKFYDHQGSNGAILQYVLSTPYDIRTRTLTATITGLGFPNWGPGDPAFSPDGGRVAIGSRSRGAEIIGGRCEVPFDLTTFTQEATINAPDNDPSCCKWNNDGTTLYARHASPDMVNEFSTSNPYSLTGMTFVRQAMPDTSFAAGGIEFNYYDF